MTVSFNNVPASIRVPLFYAEVDSSRAGGSANNNVSLLIGQKRVTGSAAVDTPLLIATVDQAKSLFGVGSMLARMAEAYRNNDNSTPLWAIAVADGSGAAAAAGGVTIAGTATATGTLVLYVAGQRVLVPVVTGDSETVVATSIATAVTALTDLPVTATSNLGVATLTANHAGLAGNDIDIRLNFRGDLGGESTPAGITAVVAAMSGGTVNPDLTTTVAAIGDTEFDYIALPYTDTTSLDVIGAEMNDTVGRWSSLRQVYGHVFSAMEATVSALQTAGLARNDPHVSILGYFDSPTPPWEVAAILTGEAAVHLDNDPARPLQTLPLLGMLAPPTASELTITERDILLHSGIAAASSVVGTMRLNRVVTTFQKNSFGQLDPSFLDVTTLASLTFILRFMRDRITTKFARSKLANDGTRFGDGQAIVTPAIIKAELIAAYGELETRALVENLEAFKEALIVERDVDDVNRINVLYPPDLVNQLRIFAVLAQFRLEFPAAA